MHVPGGRSPPGRVRVRVRLVARVRVSFRSPHSARGDGLVQWVPLFGSLVLLVRSNCCLSFILYWGVKSLISIIGYVITSNGVNQENPGW